jgi:hypothetical protein
VHFRPSSIAAHTASSGDVAAKKHNMHAGFTAGDGLGVHMMECSYITFQVGLNMLHVQYVSQRKFKKH